MRRVFATVISCALLSSCGYGAATSVTRPQPHASPTFNTGTVLIDTAHGSVLVHVLVAESEAQWAYGLMNRSSIPSDAGMIFLFQSPTATGFWMKDTTIPLSIAFFDVNGKIEAIQDMKPCAKNPCPTYEPGMSFSGALEVNQGAFRRWGVSTGDKVNLTQSGT